MNKDLAQQFVSDWIGGMAQRQPDYRPTCTECGQPITGESYNGRCGSCSSQIAREEDDRGAYERRLNEE